MIEITLGARCEATGLKLESISLMALLLYTNEEV